jgi:L-threonylcarbamoyladenylate synthase
MGTRRRRVSVIYFISKLVKWDDLRMEIISNPTQVDIRKAAQALKDGHLVAFPTETVYGLGADATNENAVSRIYSVKDRPSDHPLIVHISSINQLEKWAIDIQEYAVKLARDFWPGPMTLILKRSQLAKNYITGGQSSVGLRVPAQPIAHSLLANFEKNGGLGIAAPSANRFGAVSPTLASDVSEELQSYLNRKDLILDGGPCSVGLESTIIDCTGPDPIILRLGAITRQMIFNSLNLKADIGDKKSNTRVPGLLKSHYSPKAKVYLDTLPNPGDGFIAMSHILTPKGAIRLAAPKNVEEFAKYFYGALRLGDKQDLKNIHVVQPRGLGLAEAIRDRLEKAASG